jgi:hypothetical protein
MIKFQSCAMLLFDLKQYIYKYLKHHINYLKISEF